VNPYATNPYGITPYATTSYGTPPYAAMPYGPGYGGPLALGPYPFPQGGPILVGMPFARGPGMPQSFVPGALEFMPGAGLPPSSFAPMPQPMVPAQAALQYPTGAPVPLAVGPGAVQPGNLGAPVSRYVPPESPAVMAEVAGAQAFREAPEALAAQPAVAGIMAQPVAAVPPVRVLPSTGGEAPVSGSPVAVMISMLALACGLALWTWSFAGARRR
jgi:hypothetical protein